MKTKRLLIRTDAAPHIGSGHAMRCLALAQTARDYGVNVTFVMKEWADFIEKRLNAEGYQIAHITNEAEFDLFEGDRIVVDGYQFDAEYQDNLKKRGFRVLFLDDFGHCDRYASDIVLNQNIYANDSFYKNKSDNTQLLLGPKYVLLRREFLQKHRRGSVLRDAPFLCQNGAPQDDTPAIKPNILITLGGFDQFHVTEKIQNALNGINANIRIANHAENMPALMEWADVAVTAAGTTVYELAYMGVPMALIVLADNQKRVAEGMEKAGFGINLGWHENVTEISIQNAVAALTYKKITPSPLIDGFGAHRVLSCLFEWPLWLRPVTNEDSKLLFEWANDPSTRAASFSQDPIPWEDHQKWFEDKLHDPNCHIFIGIDQDDHPIGQIRFETKNSTTEIDIAVAASVRGRGYGSSLIDLGTRRFFSITDATEVYAIIKPKNTASLQAFQKAGFTPTATRTPYPPATYRLSRQRADYRI